MGCSSEPEEYRRQSKPATIKLRLSDKTITLVSSYLLKPQAFPGSQIGTGHALLLATMVVFGDVATDFEASMWSAAKPVISIPRTRARTAIFMAGILFWFCFLVIY
jgi:hypothetical protein